MTAPPSARPPSRARSRSRAVLTAAGVLGVFALVALLAPMLIPDHSLSVVAAQGQPLQPPSLRYPLGTDEHGLSVLTLALAGARVSLGVGFFATVLAVGVGALVGLGAGSLRGWPAATLVWITDWFLTMPQVPLAITLVAVLRPGIIPLVLAIGLTSWAPVARVVRASVLGARSRPHLDRVRALGAGEWYIARIHLLPEVMPVIALSSALTLANAILAEAAFSFLGLGDPAAVSWGSMLRQASASGALTGGAWWYLLTPGLAVIVVVLAAGICANAVRTAVPSWN
jgi:peptide/nickel transport system permease protein